MNPVISVAAGLGLAAAAGFRAFVPLLFMSLAARSGHLSLTPGMEWVASDAALLALATATIAEVLAYYIPWLDNLLDTIATPSAVVAGVMATAAVTPDLPPLLRWIISILGGGGAAGLVQGSTVLLRLKSTAFTGGLANPIVATGELIGAIVVAGLALLLPILCLVVVLLLLVAIARKARAMARRNSPARGTAVS
jgi:uncharacterized protein DUF4126